MTDKKILTGQTESHLVSLDGKFKIHQDAKEPFLLLQRKAKQAGFDLQIASSFRNFETQLRIFGEKISGKRPVKNERGQLLDVTKTPAPVLLEAILRWSALPGASRHHWGTDFDIFDKSATPANYQLQLIPSEYVGDGYYAKLSEWLDSEMAALSFFRPYETDRAGVHPERWHLSYGPVSRGYLKDFSETILEEVISSTEAYPLRDEVLSSLSELFHRYVTNID